MLLSAYAYFRGWLDWETNGGPPFLGFALAWLMDNLIRRNYRKRYDLTFESEYPWPGAWSQSDGKGIIPIIAVIGLLLAWYLDVNLHSRLRFMPLWFGLLVCLCGVNWLRNRWMGYGFFHAVLGIFLIGLGVAPLVAGISPESQYFGFEGIYELSAAGVVILAIGIVEHRIILLVCGSDF